MRVYAIRGYMANELYRVYLVCMHGQIKKERKVRIRTGAITTVRRKDIIGCDVINQRGNK